MLTPSGDYANYKNISHATLVSPSIYMLPCVEYGNHSTAVGASSLHTYQRRDAARGLLGFLFINWMQHVAALLPDGVFCKNR